MEKSKLTAALLALFGGAFGLHKFYLNDPGSGIFYAILTLMTSKFFPIAAMLGVLDAIRLFTMSTAKFDSKYNKNSRQRRSRNTKVKSNRDRRTNRDMEMQRSKYKYDRATQKKQRSNPFRKSGDQKFKEYDLEGALADYEKAVEITPADKEMHFNIACIYSLLEKKDLSLQNLELAIQKGYKNFEHLKVVDELAFLRIQPEWESFVKNNYTIVKRTKAVEPPEGDLLQNDVLLAQLNKLKELRSRGMLSEKEFSYEKEKLMRR